MRRRFTTVLLTAAFLLTAPAAVAAPSAPSALHPLAELSGQRVQIANKVAAAKFGTTQPIDDPVREQQILDGVAAKAPGLGLDPAAAVEFFRDQIEANKVVQRGLYDYWTANPEQAPTHRPDLPTEIRPVIDRINEGLLTELAATSAVRARPSCGVRLVLAIRAVDRELNFYELHRRALRRSLDSACEGH
ncbi:chorismate mutase [Amycolatopsis magusensis]|uniref:chorismate mutase n=1 Tax=Amycolatopsis magusensis TaxID=882444 RepID=UPI0024A8CB1E|nr:chorismate mutase [Amycolatopsis magusensis]MDI5980587.1 chorismate mutase [Amycolatopsis magusensis]